MNDEKHRGGGYLNSAAAAKMRREQVQHLQQKYRILKQMHDQVMAAKRNRAEQMRNMVVKKTAKFVLKKAVKHFVLHAAANTVLPVVGSFIVGAATASDIADAVDAVNIDLPVSVGLFDSTEYG